MSLRWTAALLPTKVVVSALLWPLSVCALASLQCAQRAMVGAPKPPNHSIFVDNAFKFVFGLGLAGGGVWKMWSMTGADHHDHEALIRSENAKELDR